MGTSEFFLSDSGRMLQMLSAHPCLQQKGRLGLTVNGDPLQKQLAQEQWGEFAAQTEVGCSKIRQHQALGLHGLVGAAVHCWVTRASPGTHSMLSSGDELHSSTPCSTPQPRFMLQSGHRNIEQGSTNSTGTAMSVATARATSWVRICRLPIQPKQAVWRWTLVWADGQ